MRNKGTVPFSEETATVAAAAELTQTTLSSLQPVSSRLKLMLVAAAILVAPFTIRAADFLALDGLPGPEYLPSLEIRRARVPFDPAMAEDFAATPPARWVFVGDSMLGTRIHAQYLSELSSTGRERVMMVMAPASGPSWWFLAFKNWLVAIGAKPRGTFIFFRDTNLTDTMFSLENLYGGELDRVAHDEEPELDRLVAARSRYAGGAHARAAEPGEPRFHLFSILRGLGLEA